MKQTRHAHNHEKKVQFFSLLIAGILIAITVASAACLTPTKTTEILEPAINTTPAVTKLAPTGSLEVNGEPGYTVYLDGKHIGDLQSHTLVFSSIEPGFHNVTVEQFGVTGTTQVLIEPDKKASISIGLSKNQMLLRMAKALGWNRY